MAASLAVLCMLLVCSIQICLGLHTRSSSLRTTLACSLNRAVTNTPNLIPKMNTVKQLLTTDTMCLTEMIDNEVIESLVEFDDNGNIVFLTSGGNGVQDVKGIWIHGKNGNVLKMIIERTYLGKFSSKTIKSHYVGLLNQRGNNLNNIVVTGKEIDFNMHDSESVINNGEISINNVRYRHENGAFYLSNLTLGDGSASSTKNYLFNEEAVTSALQ